MKPERFKRTKSAVASSALALVVASATFGIASLVVGTRSASPQRLGFELTSGPCAATSVSPPTFAVCGPAPGTGPVLYPGAGAKTVALNFYNPLSVAIDVTSLTVSFSGIPTTCDSSAFTFGGPGVSTTTGTQPNVTLNLGTYIHVMANSGTTSGATYDATLAMANKAGQDHCKNLTLTMAYTATAQYTANTTTVLASAPPSPSVLGQSVTFTATVSASNAPSPSSGAVKFYTCTSATVCPNGTLNLLGTGSITSGTAKYSTTAGQLTQGLNYVDAVYPGSGSDGNYNTSTSAVLTQDVQATTSTALTSTPNPSVSGSSVTFTATVTKTSGTGTPSGTVKFYKCTSATVCPNSTSFGSGTVGSGGKATYSTTTGQLSLGNNYVDAVYGGDTNFSTSTSPVLDQAVVSAACINSTINGGYTVPSNQVICITGRVNGGITVKSGSGLILNGATVNGGITSTGATVFTSCGSTINGNITISGSTGRVLIGDGGDGPPNGDDPLPACAGNAISSVTTSITNNTGGVEFGGNTVIGLVSITNNTNTVGPEVEANKITGTLTCSGNVAPPTNDGPKNTVIGVKLLQCAGSSF